MRPVAGSLSADINSDGDVTGLREPAAGCLPNQPITAGDNGDLGHGFHHDVPAAWERRADPVGLSTLITAPGHFELSRLTATWETLTLDHSECRRSDP